MIDQKKERKKEEMSQNKLDKGTGTLTHYRTAKDRQLRRGREVVERTKVTEKGLSIVAFVFLFMFSR